MRVAFAYRDNLAGRYIASQLFQSGLVHTTIAETGTHARRRKLQRDLSVSWSQKPIVFLDMVSTVIISSILSYRIRLRLPITPQQNPDLVVDDINEQQAITYIRSIDPDLLLISGTSIAREPVLSIADVTLNIHGGVVPRYRNVHSTFWALLNGDFNNIGTTILWLEPGIDDGRVALQAQIPRRDARAGLATAISSNTVLAATLARRAIRLAQNGMLPATPQDHELACYWPTPTFTDWFRLLRKLLSSAP